MGAACRALLAILPNLGANTMWIVITTAGNQPYAYYGFKTYNDATIWGVDNLPGYNLTIIEAREVNENFPETILKAKRDSEPKLT